MAVPTIIEMQKLQNQFRDGTFTPEDSDSLVDIPVESDTPVTLGAVHKENFQKMIFEMLNNGANPADFMFYGAALDDIDGTEHPHAPPPDEDSNEWMELPNGIITVLANDNDGRIVTDFWTYIMIRLARTNAGQDTVVTLRIRGQ